MCAQARTVSRIRAASRPPWFGNARGYSPRSPQPGVDLFLDANEGRPFESALERMASMDGTSLARYPSFVELEASIARFWKVDAGRVVCTAGGDEAIARVCATRLAPGAKALVFEPAFAMFGAYARGRGAEVVALPWYDSDNFPLAEALETVRGCPSLGLVCLANPSNPTGAALGRTEAMSLARACEEAGVAFLFDAAYAEFADDDPTGVVSTVESAYVVRTFSKAYGLAGLRVGYVLAPTCCEADKLRAAGSPYPSSPLAAELASTSLEDRDGLAGSVQRVLTERADLFDVLTASGARAVPSQANFVFARVADAPGLVRALAERGIAIRGFEESPGLADAVRITCPGDERDYARLRDALQAVRRFL